MINYDSSIISTKHLEITPRRIAYFLGCLTLGMAGALSIYFAHSHFNDTTQYTSPTQDSSQIERDLSPSPLENTADRTDQ